MRAGDKVTPRSPAEILETLDEQGCLDGVPFMPEMLGFLGGTFVVEAQVERACDTIGRTGARRLPETVLLDDLRCDGSAHAGCQAQCRLYWKEAWLRPESSSGHDGGLATDDAYAQLERRAADNVGGADSTPNDPTFRCQATELVRASEPVGWWSVRSFAHELTGGNVGFWRFTRVMTRIVVEEIGRRLRLVSSYPFRKSHQVAESIVHQPPTGLRPGDHVQIRTPREISKTIGPNGKNRGLWFDREMLPYCGQTARVKTKVERFIDERSGRVIELASDCYILEDVVCQSYRSDGRWFCPRAIYPWWRECWLRPIDVGDAGAGAPDKH